MSQVAWPLGFCLFAWWFGTGAILWLDGLPRRTFRWSLGGATLVCAAALVGLWACSRVESPAAAYCAFTCAMLVWAWQELAFLLGVVTGPRREPCPPEAKGWQRAWLALQAIAHHELALVVLAGCVAAATWDQPNQTGWWTYVILWTMRQSAKLNVFLGVRNLAEQFLPPHLKYLESYFTRRPMNALLPISVLGASAFAWPLWQAALRPGAPAWEATSLALLASLLSLAILEHLFLVMPLPLDALFKWGMGSRPPARPGEEDNKAAVII